MDGFIEKGYSNGYLFIFKLDKWMYHQFAHIDVSMDVLTMPDYIQKDYFGKNGKILTIENLDEFKKGGLEEKVYIEVRRDLVLDNLFENGW